MGINYFRRDDRDAKFVLFEQLDMDRLLGYEAFKDFSKDDFAMIVDEALKMCREVLGPANQEGDRIGAQWKDGVVTTPDSFKECWKVMTENGWLSMKANPEYGGQGLPATIGAMANDFFTGANMAFVTYPGLTVGAGHVIENYGTDEDRTMFVEKLYTGNWAGTMCLTEPDAGSDVGWLRTKAVPDPDAGDPRVYKIQGSKRFITSGQHDLTENIVHLVLARIEGAPHGTKGISLFIVPRTWVNPDGSMGEPNDVYCEGIEHKMGIHGSATASLLFGENNNCRGILLGEPHSGMAKMFQLMNEARLGCGVQSLGIAASAYDAARYYAKERVQGPPFTDRAAERVPIIEHEDVRRMLMNLKSGTEGMRAFTADLVFNLDVAENDPDPEARKKAHQRADLLLPVLKSYTSDYGWELCRDAIQVFGGAGFCCEFPVEQYARDIKIISIWEGTSYIQSLDLVGRKMGMEGGKVFQGWLQDVMDFTSAHKDDQDLAGDFKRLFKAAQAVGDYAMKYMTWFSEGKLKLIPLSSTRFLMCMGEVCVAKLLLEQALIARNKLAGVDAASADGIFYKGKVETAKFYCRNTLTNVFSRHASLLTEDTSAVDIPMEAF